MSMGMGLGMGMMDDGGFSDHWRYLPTHESVISAFRFFPLLTCPLATLGGLSSGSHARMLGYYM